MPKKTAQPSIEVSGEDAVLNLSSNGEPEPKPKPRPIPKPGDKDFDWKAEYGTDKLYVHTFKNGTVVALKELGSIFSKTWLYKIRNLKTDVDLEIAALDRASCDAARDVLDSLDDSAAADPIDELFKAWSAAGTSRGDGDEGLTSGN